MAKKVTKSKKTATKRKVAKKRVTKSTTRSTRPVVKSILPSNIDMVGHDVEPNSTSVWEKFKTWLGL